jgi:6-pyruvoyltetrahydropterin/6-carboxytetrahydropterin synthase
MYSVTKTFHFCAAHRLHDYEGKCSNIHGHNYKVEVSLESIELEKGMVVDFGEMTKTIGNWIDVNLDHAFIICQWDNKTLYDMLKICKLKHFVMSNKTTAEHIAQMIFQQCTTLFCREGLFIREVKVWETESCWASYS